MQCDDAKELLSPYLDSEIAPPERAAFESHLAVCQQCADEISAYRKNARLSKELVDPIPPSDLWSQIQSKTEGASCQAKSPVAVSRRMAWKTWRVVVTALLLVGIGITYMILEWPDSNHHKTVNLDSYLTEFARDPEIAQSQLLAKYEHREVTVTEAAQQVSYQPAAAGTLPESVAVKRIRVFEMPCCRCLQTICIVDGKQTVVIFEHDDEHSLRFGQRPSVTCQCKGHRTQIIQFDGHIVASWPKGKRHLTLVGARDLGQVVQFVERLE